MKEENNNPLENDLQNIELPEQPEEQTEHLLNEAQTQVERKFEAERQVELQENLEEEARRPGQKLKSFVHAVVLPVLYGILIALVLTQVMFFHAEVPSGSMETTIMTGDRIVGNRMAYWFGQPTYGEIVIFWSAEYNEFMVKRVIGCPGDHVELRSDGVYVNDRRVRDDYVQGTTSALRDGENDWIVPANSYFLLGDNRENSADSRYWNQTFIPEDEIYAKYMFRYSLGKNGWYCDWRDPVDFWAEE